MATPIDVVAEVHSAEQRVRPHVATTPVLPAAGLSEVLGSPVVLKCENLQHTGSFKARGAVSKVLSLDADELHRGIVTASTGNHGAAVAFAAGIVGARALVIVPEGANAAKLTAIERHGGRIEVHGHDSVDSELAARSLAGERGMTFISPYNDPVVIGGQGTLGLELLDQVEELGAVFVAVGGGGLASGVAAIVKARSPRTRVIGCSPAASAVMYHSLRAGRILQLPSEPTLSDGTAGGVEPGAITFDLLDALLDDFVTVEEADIREAFLDLIETEHLLVEGSAAMAYAAARATPLPDVGTSAVVLCGGNVGLDRLRSILGS
jgi:threonine dehydratase